MCTQMTSYSLLNIAELVYVLKMMVVLMVIPPAVLILPLFLGLQPFGLVDSHPGVVLIYTGLLVPISTYLLVSFFRTLPAEVFEAARRLKAADGKRCALSSAWPTWVHIEQLSVWHDRPLATR